MSTTTQCAFSLTSGSLYCSPRNSVVKMDEESKYRAIATGLLGMWASGSALLRKGSMLSCRFCSRPACPSCSGQMLWTSCVQWYHPNSRPTGCLLGVMSANELPVLEQPFAQTLNTQELAVETADSFSPISTMEHPECSSEPYAPSRNCASELVKSMISLEKGRWLS